jgi:hypothetical protein
MKKIILVFLISTLFGCSLISENGKKESVKRYTFIYVPVSSATYIIKDSLVDNTPVKISSFDKREPYSGDLNYAPLERVGVTMDNSTINSFLVGADYATNNPIYDYTVLNNKFYFQKLVDARDTCFYKADKNYYYKYKRVNPTTILREEYYKNIVNIHHKIGDMTFIFKE